MSQSQYEKPFYFIYNYNPKSLSRLQREPLQVTKGYKSLNAVLFMKRFI